MNAALRRAGAAPRVLWCTTVGLNFNPISQCLFQCFEAVLPWDLLAPPSAPPPADLRERVRFIRRELAAFRAFCKRQEEGCKARGEWSPFKLHHLRATEMKGPHRDHWCALSLGVRRASPGRVEQVLGALVAWVRRSADEASLERALAGEAPMPRAPPECVFLRAPRMDLHELKIQRSLSGRFCATPEQEGLIAEAEEELRGRIVAREAEGGALRAWAEALPAGQAG